MRRLTDRLEIQRYIAINHQKVILCDGCDGKGFNLHCHLYQAGRTKEVYWVTECTLCNGTGRQFLKKEAFTEDIEVQDFSTFPEENSEE